MLADEVAHYHFDCAGSPPSNAGHFVLLKTLSHDMVSHTRLSIRHGDDGATMGRRKRTTLSAGAKCAGGATGRSWWRRKR